VVYHTITWLIWLGAAAYLALVNHQPLQSALLILSTGMIFTLAGHRGPLRQGPHAELPQAEGWRAFLRLGLWVWLVALAFNLLFVHAGSIVLLVLPRNWPLVGGPITLEALLYGLANGASLFAVLLTFATFNLVVDQHRLLRWVPAGLFQAGLIVSIALTFVPQMITSLKGIREAQQIRGHRFRGLRDLIPLFMPLITTALERSLTLAESMEARGFGGIAQERPRSLALDGRVCSSEVDGHKGLVYGQIVSERPRSLALDGHVCSSEVDGHKGPAYGDNALAELTTKVVTTNLMMLAGLLALLAGLLWQAMKPQMQWPGLALLELGLMLVLVGLYAQGRHLKRTHYRRELWRWRDTLVSLACSASIVIVAYTQVQNPLALSYYPYPPFSPWPRFTPLLGLAAALVAVPAFLNPQVAQIRAKDDRLCATR